MKCQKHNKIFTRGIGQKLGKTKKANKRPLRADNVSLLLSALRPRLLVSTSITFLCAFVSIFFLQNAYVSDASAVSLTLTIPNKALAIDLNPSTDNVFAKSSDGNISVSTSANWGFQLSVQAKDDNSLKNGTNSLTSIAGPIDEDAFKSGADYINKWGFKPSKLNNNTNSNFVAGPTTSPAVIEKTSASSAAPTSYTVAIGAKASNSLATGTYSNNFTFTAVANTVSYLITYNLDDGSWTGTSPETGSTTDRAINISGISPTKDKYDFKGWCTVEPTNNNSTSPTCSGTTMSPSDSYTLSNGTNNLDLYAIWEQTGPPPAVDKGALGSMQSFSCDSSLPNIHEYGTVTDSRDNNTYKVAKLMDGKCWMIDNLKIVGRSISSSNSDMTSGSFSIPSSNLTTFKTSSSTANNNAAYVDSYGGLYTWYTATAGTGNSSITSGGVNATSSICPKGWRLPTGGSSSEFNDLVTAYGGNNSTGSEALRATPVPGFTYAGYILFSNGTLTDRGSYSSYWSSTSNASNRTYDLVLDSSRAKPDGNGVRVGGYSVRCMARESSSSCFTAGTLVDTPNGPIPIEELTEGMKVYSYDFETGKVVEDAVSKNFVSIQNSVIKYTLSDNSIIQVTPHHPFYDWNTNSWKEIGEYNVGDTLKNMNGEYVTIIKKEELADSHKVYNLEASKYHNYFIIAENQERYLVHNKGEPTIPGAEA